MSELKVFEPLVADIAAFVEPTKSITVMDAQSSQSGIEVAQSIKGYLNTIEKKRKELVGPLNERVKEINEYCKLITGPLLDADARIRNQLNSYASKQEEIRRAEAAKIESERREAERKAREDRERLEEEIRARQDAESESHAEAAALFGVDGGDIELANSAIEQKQLGEWEEAQARLDREAIERETQTKQRLWDANQKQIKNTRGTWKIRVIDLSLVPKEFLIITLNEKAAVAVGKTGFKIAGLEFYEDFTVAIGARTRAPGLR